MKVIAINGSPNKNGNTAYALSQIGAELQKERIEFEIIEVGDSAQDAEGVQIMQMLGKNMSWMLRMREASKNTEPEDSEKVFTNFIR